MKRDNCVECPGPKETGGYGRLYYNGKTRTASRVIWEKTYGPIPEKMFVLHSCDNPPCINPKHLFLGTHADNMRDAAQKGRLAGQKKTHCKRGHLLDGKDSNGRRKCLTCTRKAARLNSRRYYKVKKPYKPEMEEHA